MLRTTHTSVLSQAKRKATRRVLCRSVTGAQLIPRKFFADQAKIDRAILPGSRSADASTGVRVPELPSTSPSAGPTESHIPVALAPRIPPTPTEVQARAPPASSTAAPLPPLSPLPPRPRRRFRSFLIALVLVTTLGFSGGIYYSLISDNFHDFFTEYVPFGEDAVAYFEEREFRKRFPRKEAGNRTWGQTRGENKVTISRSSGIQPKVSEKIGENTSPVKDVASKVTEKHSASQLSRSEPASASSVTSTQKGSSFGQPATAVPATASNAVTKSAVEPAKSTVPAVQLSAVSHIDVKQAEEPVVQDAVKMVNKVITALNASALGHDFSAVVDGLKQDIAAIANGIGALKSKQTQEHESKLNDAHAEFDGAAKELLRRVEREMQETEIKWREEYEAERERLLENFQRRLAAELDLSKQIADEEAKTTLLDRELTLQQEHMTLVKSKVEQERNGRLAKLDELATSVSELEKLTQESTSLVESTITTQQIQIAVEAVRARVLNASGPTPFIDELIALKTVSGDDSVVSAAISCISPATYQQGVSPLSHLIDRFRRVAAEVRKAALLPEDAGIASHAASAVLSRLMFQKKADRGLPVGDDVEATLARAEALLEEGDLDMAAREVNGLQGWAGVLSRDWVNECRRVLEVRQALEVISTQARLKSLLTY